MKPSRWRVWTNASPDGPAPARFYVLMGDLSTDQADWLVTSLKAAGWDANRQRIRGDGPVLGTVRVGSGVDPLKRARRLEGGAVEYRQDGTWTPCRDDIARTFVPLPGADETP